MMMLTQSLTACYFFITLKHYFMYFPIPVPNKGGWKKITIV